MSTREIHLELAGELSTDSFIQALRQLISRRGHPKQIRSDNSPNFVGAKREITEALRHYQKQKLANNITKNNIEWYLNPPSTPGMGGTMDP